MKLLAAVLGLVFSANAIAQAADTAQSPPRLRGTMVSPNIDDAGLKTLGQGWNANLIRWPLVFYSSKQSQPTTAEYDAWLDGALKRLDAALPSCERYGLNVAIAIHSAPGGGFVQGYFAADGKFFTDKSCQDRFVANWQSMTKRYKDAKAVWAFDIVNEAGDIPTANGCQRWQDLALRTAKAIREIDPQRRLIVEAPQWGDPKGFVGFHPIDCENVVYSFHMYLPHKFTHQRLSADGPPVPYPGEIEGRHWDKAALDEAMKPAIEFQKQYHVPIYVGEFSAIRWAPGDSGYRYLKDVIELFEEHGWDWSYHTFREWDGWSVEHTGDRSHPAPATQPTAREKLLREWFSHNQKPRWK